MFDRITIELDKMAGQPCLRGLRIPVATVVAMVAAGPAGELGLPGVVAIAGLAMGLYPRPFTEGMHQSVLDLLAHVARSKM